MPLEPPQPNNPPHAEVTPELAAKLHAYHKAVEEEFNVIQRAVESGEAEDIATAARNFLIKETAKAAETIGWLSANATSEATRLQASKFILEHTLGVKGIAAPHDPMEALVQELKGNSPAKAKERAAAAAAATSEGSLVPPEYKPMDEERG